MGYGGDEGEVVPAVEMGMAGGAVVQGLQPVVQGEGAHRKTPILRNWRKEDGPDDV